MERSSEMYCHLCNGGACLTIGRRLADGLMKLLTPVQATAGLLEADPSLWCVSSWNDNGLATLDWKSDRLVRCCLFKSLALCQPCNHSSEFSQCWSHGGGCGTDFTQCNAQRCVDGCIDMLTAFPAEDIILPWARVDAAKGTLARDRQGISRSGLGSLDETEHHIQG